MKILNDNDYENEKQWLRILKNTNTFGMTLDEKIDIDRTIDKIEKNIRQYEKIKGRL